MMHRMIHHIHWACEISHLVLVTVLAPVDGHFTGVELVQPYTFAAGTPPPPETTTTGAGAGCGWYTGC